MTIHLHNLIISQRPHFQMLSHGVWDFNIRTLKTHIQFIPFYLWKLACSYGIILTLHRVVGCFRKTDLQRRQDLLAATFWYIFLLLSSMLPHSFYMFKYNSSLKASNALYPMKPCLIPPFTSAITWVISWQKLPECWDSCLRALCCALLLERSHLRLQSLSSSRTSALPAPSLHISRVPHLALPTADAQDTSWSGLAGEMWAPVPGHLQQSAEDSDYGDKFLH